MAHYYTEEQDSVRRTNEFEAVLRGNKFRFITVSGTFSLSHVDKGSILLIENAIIKNDWMLLDLGCGWGAVGVAFAKLGLDVTMTDINRRAVEFARKNLKLNKLKANVVQGDCFQKVKDEFDTILLNPPQTAGKNVCFKMIEESINYLKPGGILQLVARHQKGGKHLSQKMDEVFGNVKDLAKGSGFRVYVSKKE